MYFKPMLLTNNLVVDLLFYACCRMITLVDLVYLDEDYLELHEPLDALTNKLDYRCVICVLSHIGLK